MGHCFTPQGAPCPPTPGLAFSHFQGSGQPLTRQMSSCGLSSSTMRWRCCLCSCFWGLCSPCLSSVWSPWSCSSPGASFAGSWLGSAASPLSPPSCSPRTAPRSTAKLCLPGKQRNHYDLSYPLGRARQNHLEGLEKWVLGPVLIVGLEWRPENVHFQPVSRGCGHRTLKATASQVLKPPAHLFLSEGAGGLPPFPYHLSNSGPDVPSCPLACDHWPEPGSNIVSEGAPADQGEDESKGSQVSTASRPARPPLPLATLPHISSRWLWLRALQGGSGQARRLDGCLR